LSSDRYILHPTATEPEFFNFVEQHKQSLDCLVLEEKCLLLPLINLWYERGALLPIVIFLQITQESEIFQPLVVSSNPPDSTQTSDNSLPKQATYLFHAAEVQLAVTQVHEIGNFIEKAIAQFISLSPACGLPETSATTDFSSQLITCSFLIQQQRRLAEKLKERLGYLGVYYKRNSQLFLRNLSHPERQKLLENLKSEYRQIVLQYFSQENSLNQKIDNFVDKAFFSDISVSKIVEMHMELMEEFSKQLKLEGRSEEVLLDYRLTLIDVIAHLGEMYRRSIPRES
jgi:circadian clock protein KaiA